MDGTESFHVHDHGNHQIGVNEFNPKYNIHGLEYALENITFERSLLLWSVLLENTNKLKGYIERTTNQEAPIQEG